MHSVKANSPLPAPSSRVGYFGNLLLIFRRVLAGLRTLRGAVKSFMLGAFCSKPSITRLVCFYDCGSFFAQSRLKREATPTLVMPSSAPIWFGAI